MLDVTTVMLTFNRLDYTKACIKSYLKFAPKNQELIIIDNGSTDGTREYLKKITRDDVRVLLSPKNLYPAGGYKKGLKMAKPSKAYLICDNDGFFDTCDWYSIGMTLFAVLPNVGIIGMRRKFGKNYEPTGFLDHSGIKYKYSHSIGSFTMLDNRARELIINKLKGKWIGIRICETIEKYGNLESILVYPGYITDVSIKDLDNPKYRDMYLQYWKEKGCLTSFHAKIKRLEEHKKREAEASQ